MPITEVQFFKLAAKQKGIVSSIMVPPFEAYNIFFQRLRLVNDLSNNKLNHHRKFFCFHRDTITVSKDDWGVQSPPQ